MTFAPSRILVARDAPLELLVPSPVRTPLATEEDFLFPLRDDGPWHAVGEPESDPLGRRGLRQSAGGSSASRLTGVRSDRKGLLTVLKVGSGASGGEPGWGLLALSSAALRLSELRP